MIDDRHVDFFLDGNFGNAPIALEIPIEGSNKYALAQFLRVHGLDIGTSPNQIVLTDDSIMTPVVAPENIKKLYRTIELLVADFNNTYIDYDSRISLGYPHVIDIDRTIPSKLEADNWPERTTYIDDMLKQIVGHERTADNLIDMEKDFRENVSQLQSTSELPRNILFAGSNISNPYSVATGESKRFFRYATTNPGYAIGYCNLISEKRFNGYTTMSKSGIKYGFVHLYSEKDYGKQLFFQNAGIEGRVDNTINHGTDETMVNRFNNECVGEYLVFAVPSRTDVYGYRYGFVKIPQNDEKWEKFKEYAKTNNARLHGIKDRRIDEWASGKNKEPVLPLLKQMSVTDFYEFTQKNIESEKQTRLENINQINQEVKNVQEKSVKLLTDFNKLLDTIVKPNENIKDFDALLEKYSNVEKELNSKHEKFKQESDKIVAQFNELDQKITNITLTWDIKQNIETIKKLISTAWLDFQHMLADTNTKLSDKNVSSWIYTLQYKKEQYIFKIIHEHYSLKENKTSFEQFNLNTKKHILKQINEEIDINHPRENDLRYLLKLSIFVYYCATPEQRIELFDDLYNLRKSDIKNVRKLLEEANKNLVSSGFTPLPEITELIKRDNIFVKHTKKSQKIILDKKKLFEQASQNLQNTMSYNIRRKSDLNIIMADDRD